MRLLENVTLDKAEQYWNADSPIVVTEFGIVTLVKRIQLSKHAYGIVVNLFEIVRLVRLLHNWKA